MDIDLDLEGDKIKVFLQSKLDEIKAKNEQLQGTLQQRRIFLKEVIENANDLVDESGVTISSEIWKIFNGKYVLAATVTNESSRPLRGLRVILTWDSVLPLTHQIKIYEENENLHSASDSFSSAFCNKENCNSITDSLAESDEIDKKAYVTVTFDQPQFLDSLSYDVTGNMIYQRDGKDISVVFPLVQISSADATNSRLNDFPLFENVVRDVLTIMSSSVRTDLVTILPSDWGNSFNTTFEILCSLQKIDVPSRCRHFFVAHRLSPSVDGTLLEVHDASKAHPNVFSMVVYARDQDRLLSLLHHLHRNIQGVVIIPKASYENYILQQSSYLSMFEERENLEKFNECVDREIKLVKKFLQENRRVGELNSTDVVKFRLDLADLEESTDMYYLRLCKMNDD